MFIIDNKRIVTMRKHLGEASELIKNDAYLPMFRNRQKKYKQEFDESVEVAKKKRDPARYLASIWSVKNLEQSLLWMRSRIARAINELARQRQEKKQRKMEEKVRRDMNYSGRAKMSRMYSDMGICLKS
jgi:hypothetical protein